MSDLSQTTQDMLTLSKEELADADVAWAREHFGSEALDRGIIRPVRILKEDGVETCQSCEGGDGHCYEYPSVDILGQPWRALDLCNTYGLPVHTVSHQFSIREGEPVENVWRLEFSPHLLLKLYKEWYGDAEAMDGIGWTRDRQQFAEDARQLAEKQKTATLARSAAMVLQMRCDLRLAAVFIETEMFRNEETGPWTVLRFDGADDIAIRKSDGAAFYVNREGERSHDPFLEWSDGGRAILFAEPT